MQACRNLGLATIGGIVLARCIGKVPCLLFFSARYTRKLTRMERFGGRMPVLMWASSNTANMNGYQEISPHHLSQSNFCRFLMIMEDHHLRVILKNELPVICITKLYRPIE